MENFRIDSRGARVNPNCKPSENIYAQIARHRANKAKGTTEQQINAVLDN